MDITAIAITGIICYGIVSLSRDRTPSKKSKAFESKLQAEHSQMQQELQIMADRLAVLEQIVTDEKYQLKREFDSL
jgi:hypothetical protein